MDSTLIFLILSLLVALLGTAQLISFLTLKREIGAARDAAQSILASSEARAQLQSALVERLASELEQVRETPLPAPSAAFSLNLTRRQQVLQLSRQGSAPDQIASTLQIPRREVALILKLQQGPPAASAGAARPGRAPTPPGTRASSAGA